MAGRRGAERPSPPGTALPLRLPSTVADPVLHRDVLRGTVLRAVHVAVLLGAAWAELMTEDVTS